MSIPRRIAPRLTLTPQGLVPNRVLTIEHGVITHIECDSSPSSEVEVVDAILTPPMVNAHCHTELSYLKGAIPPQCGFTGFAKAMREARGKFSEQQRIDAIKKADLDMWSEGIRVVADVCNGATSFGAKLESRGVKYLNFIEVFGLQTSSLEQTQRVAERSIIDGFRTAVTPHSTYSLSHDMFRQAVEATPDEPLSIHFMESRDEIELFKGRGSMADWYAQQGFKPDFLHYGSPAERLVAQVPHDRTTLLIHNCYITQRDIDMVMNHFTAPVWWVVCPNSNRYISNSTPPIELLRANGLNIAVGTDSLATNRELSMVSELQALGEDIPLSERLCWITQGGAQALGLNGGSIEVGTTADFLLL